MQLPHLRRAHAHTVLFSAVAAMLAGCTTAPPAPSAASTAPTAAAATPAPATPAAAPPAAPGATPAPAAGASAAARPAAAGTAPAARPPTPPAPGTPQPFADVTKDAASKAGFLTVWTKDEKTWLEIPADKLNQPFFLSASLANGLGERFFWPGLTAGRQQVVVFRRVGNTVQLVARNLLVRAPAGTPLEKAVAESYADSLIASAPLAAAPHPERKSLLVDASALLGGDIAGVQTQLENGYRLPYALDRANSSIERTTASPEATTLTLRSHYAIPKLPASPVLTPGAPPPNPAALPSPPTVVPDARSLFLSHTYTLAPLPAEPMAARRADPRVGHFTSAFMNLADPSTGDSRTHIVNRWRLEKKDPAAAVSEPKQPIRVVMDRNIPEKWRPALREAALEWNKAFERAGFKNAIVVEQQAADADWSSLEGTRILAMRWFALEGPGATAVGPSHADPRTGEILRAAAIIPENWARLERTRVAEVLPVLAGNTMTSVSEAECSYGSLALAEASFGYELLSLRGQLDPDSPQSEKYIAAALKDVTMHEVGHALGLRHNFRGTAGITAAQLRDPKFTAERGISNSIMDYPGLNMPLDGEPPTDYVQPTIGSYDYWAIEYAYKQFDPAKEASELAAIAARSETDPALAYSTDEDIPGIDPLVNQRDLTDDPLGFAQRQVKLARELWARTQARTPKPNDDMTVDRRNLQRGLGYMASSAQVAGRFIGGTYTSRSLGGKKPLLVPVQPEKQKAALDLILNEIFSTTSLRFDPKFMSRLGVEQLERTAPGRVVINTDYSLAETVLSLQRNSLDTLMSDTMAGRLADAETKVDDPKTLLTYADVQNRLATAAWAELKGGKGTRKGEIEAQRRALQREHLRRLATGLLRPSAAVATDVRAVHRQVAQRLQGELKAALAAGGWSSIAEAHLTDSLATLNEALKAPLTKQGA